MLTVSNFQKSTIVTSSIYEGKIVIITGASAGIGKATAEFLAAKGVKAITLFARRADKIKAFEAELNKANPNVQTLVVAGDAANANDNKRVVEETVAKFGGVSSAFINAVSYHDRLLTNNG